MLKLEQSEGALHGFTPTEMRFLSKEYRWIVKDCYISIWTDPPPVFLCEESRRIMAVHASSETHICDIIDGLSTTARKRFI